MHPPFERASPRHPNFIGVALPYDQRPEDDTPLHTADLPATPQRDRNIPARAWLEAPDALKQLGNDIGGPEAQYKRRIGRWLLWRAGPATGGDARYMAVADDGASAERPTYRLHPDGAGSGTGADGAVHQRFRAWKESLRDY